MGGGQCSGPASRRRASTRLAHTPPLAPPAARTHPTWPWVDPHCLLLAAPQAVQEIYKFRKPETIPLNDPEDYELLRFHLASGQFRAYTFYGEMRFNAYGQNEGREPSTMQLNTPTANASHAGDATPRTIFPTSRSASVFVFPSPAATACPATAYSMVVGDACLLCAPGACTIAGPNLPMDILIPLASLAGLYIALTLFRRYRAARRTAKELQSLARRNWGERAEHVQSICLSSSQLAFPFCVVSYAKFRERGALWVHEDARRAGELVVLDTVAEVEAEEAAGCVFIFLSHEWKASVEPDPHGDDFSACVAAVDQLVRDDRLDVSKLRIWIDYTSIPQVNTACQRLSIASLPVYTKFASYFLIVAPNVSMGAREFSFDTYSRRGWCRLEQWAARLCQRGTDKMYICEGGAPRDVSSDTVLLLPAMEIWEADFSVEADKERLVDPVVVLYYVLMRRDKEASMERTQAALLYHAQAHRDTVFPPARFGDLLVIAHDLAYKGKPMYRAPARPRHCWSPLGLGLGLTPRRTGSGVEGGHLPRLTINLSSFALELLSSQRCSSGLGERTASADSRKFSQGGRAAPQPDARGSPMGGGATPALHSWLSWMTRRESRESDVWRESRESDV